MTPDVAPLLAVVMTLFLLAYFMMASIPFLFVRLDVPEVWRLFRGLFDVYLWLVPLVALLAAATFAMSGRIVTAASMLVLSSGIIASRKSVLGHLDRRHATQDPRDVDAMRQLRLTHWLAMIFNLAVLAFVASSMPVIL